MPSSQRPCAVIVGQPQVMHQVFPPAIREKLLTFADLAAADLDAAEFTARPDLLAQTELLVGTWGLPALDDDLLARMPKLRGIFYGAGSVKGFIRDAVWERGLVVSAAPAANAVPVAEFTLAAILLSLKKVWQHLQAARQHRSYTRIDPMPGNYRTTVGLVSLGLIGRLVAERLRSFDHRVIAFDPHLPAAALRDLGAEPATLEEIFAQADVVSLHTPWLPETEGMIGRALLESMKPHATLLNTARGALIREDELCDVLARRPDLTAFLDVTHPEPPAPDSPLFDRPNIFITPHIAGSMGDECGRLGEMAVDEAARFIAGQPRLHAVTREQLARMA